MKIFDAHFHIINSTYPLVANDGYIPDEFTIADYQHKTSEFNIIGGTVVSGSFQGFDSNFLIDALNIFGKDYVGVANIPAEIKEAQLIRLNNANVVAVRFNLLRGGSETIDKMVGLSDRLYDQYGWHTELYINSKDLKQLQPLLSKLKKFSIDHIGLSGDGLPELYNWVDKGIKVKATGFGRVDFDPAPVLKKIYKINPGALMFGTDLPSTRAKIKFSIKDICLIKDNFSAEAQANIFFKNALAWYHK